MRRLLLVALTLILLSRAAGKESATSCVILTPLNVMMRLGDEVTATATAHDELGNEIPDAKIQWLPTQDDPGPHCVSVIGGLITARLVGTCGVGALSVTTAGKVILHQEPISVTVSAPSPSPTPKNPCRLPNGKCRKGCICLN